MESGRHSSLNVDRTSQDGRALERCCDGWAKRWNGELTAQTVVFDGSRTAKLQEIGLEDPQDSDVIIDIDWSGISTGTERLLWSGEMPLFPGMGYPLVPGYEAVGSVVWSADRPNLVGERVFVPGARCFKGAHGLFGAAASRVVTSADRVTILPRGSAAPDSILMALAATAYHAVTIGDLPELIVGHGVVGRLAARIALALGGAAPVVWEINPDRADADGYAVFDPEFDGRTDYRTVLDASGDARIIDKVAPVMRKGGSIILAGFYSTRVGFDFPPVFMRELKMQVAAEWTPGDIDAVHSLLQSGALSFDGLVTHAVDAAAAPEAYECAFQDATCLKMVLNWSGLHG